MKKCSLLFLLFVFGCSTKHIESKNANSSISDLIIFKKCSDDQDKQFKRSIELQQIVSADQKDRSIDIDKIDWNVVSKADEERAKRVAEIFAEGCFNSSKDYAAAALVFQHGTTTDHYYQAYLWSKKAFELGDETQKLMIANTIDRYLINSGYKQIFGAQTFRNGPNGCRCLAPVELNFPEQKRFHISGQSLSQRILSLKESNNENSLCHDVIYCNKDLKSPPKGVFPGIW